jgi:GT2 family glycosyltransferase
MNHKNDVLSASVVVITRNRLWSLKKCIECLWRQTTTPSEIIVVDNSTTNETEKYIGTAVAVVYLHIAGRLGCQPILRNAGIRAAKGHIIAFLDDDGYAEPDWLTEILLCYDDSGVGGVGGRIVEGESHRSVASVGRLKLVGGVESNWNVEANEPFEVDHLQGTNMSFRRSVLEEIGGWDENLASGYATFEELDVCMRVKKRGKKIIFSPLAVVSHGVQQREGGSGRTMNTSRSLAYHVGRNGTYLWLKNFGMKPRVLAAALLINPIIGVLRCIFGSARHPLLSAVSLYGLGGALYHLAGVARGFFMILSRRVLLKHRPHGHWPVDIVERRLDD